MKLIPRQPTKERRSHRCLFLYNLHHLFRNTNHSLELNVVFYTPTVYISPHCSPWQCLNTGLQLWLWKTGSHGCKITFTLVGGKTASYILITSGDILHIAQLKLNTVQLALHIAQNMFLTTHCTLHVPGCKLHTLYCTLHTVTTLLKNISWNTNFGNKSEIPNKVDNPS